MLEPQPRFRFYGAPSNHVSALGALLSGSVQSRKDIAVTEAALSKTLAGRDVILTQQCRFALYLALTHLDCVGRKIILSPYTIYDVVNMVIAAGAKPVFCDVDRDCNLSVAKVKELIDDETAGVLLTHLHGRMADTITLRKLCDDNGIWLMEDAAQSYGAMLDGKAAGTIGHHAIFSFGRAKNVNGFFGGAFVTADPALAAAVRETEAGLPPMEVKSLYKRVASCLVNDLATAPLLFQAGTFQVLRQGSIRGISSINKVVNTENKPVRRNELPEHYKKRQTGLQARIIARQLPRVVANNEARIAAAARYAELLSDIDDIYFPELRTDGSDIYMYFPIQVPDRDALTRALMRQHVDVAIQHYHNTADLPIFSDFYRDCPACREISQRVVLLPTYPSYTRASIDRTAKAIRSFFEASD